SGGRGNPNEQEGTSTTVDCVVSAESPAPPAGDDLRTVTQLARGLGPHLLHRPRLLVRIPLLFPWIGVHVIAVLLPQSRWIPVEELEIPTPPGRHTFPFVVELRPAGHAVDVRAHGHARQPPEFLPRPGHLAFDEPEAPERPARGVEARGESVGEDGPLGGQRLARGDAVRDG